MKSFTTTGPVALVVRFTAGRLSVRTDESAGTTDCLRRREAGESGQLG